MENVPEFLLHQTENQRLARLHYFLETESLRIIDRLSRDASSSETDSPGATPAEIIIHLEEPSGAIYQIEYFPSGGYDKSGPHQPAEITILKGRYEKAEKTHPARAATGNWRSINSSNITWINNSETVPADQSTIPAFVADADQPDTKQLILTAASLAYHTNFDDLSRLKRLTIIDTLPPPPPPSGKRTPKIQSVGSFQLVTNPSRA